METTNDNNNGKMKMNTVNLAKFLFDTMHKLDRGECDVQTAATQAKLAKQLNNVFNYELERTKLQMQIKASGNMFAEIRNIEDL